jgi:hypothetical protein
MLNTRQLVLCVVLGALLLAGCSNMEEQPKIHLPYDESPTFGQSARVILPEAVPVGWLEDDNPLLTGMVDGELIDTFPVEITEEVLALGQRTFNDFCSPCHGYDGDGNGVIAREGFPQPATYHTDTLRQMPVGHFFRVITDGKGSMFSYASRIDPETRWAVVAYIRALQLSQYAEFNELPSELQAELEALDG